MTDTAEIPIPSDSGSSGEQKPATGEVLPANPQTGMPIVNAIVKGLAASPQKLGEFGSAMLAGVARQLEKDNQELRQEVKNLRKSSDKCRDELVCERVSNARLTERVNSEMGSRHFRNFGITVGTALVSVGLFPNSFTTDVLAWTLLFLGALLFLVSWFFPFGLRQTAPNRGDEN